MPKVSAIVSTYNSERFIASCLDDLIAQTMFREGGLEIVVIISGSQQGEAAIVEQYQKRYPQIVSLRTERETMYQAWNRGIALATGSYLTNANTDDRHNPDALTRLAELLDRQSEISLVYGDCYLSNVPNETYAENNKQKLYRYPHFFAPAAVLHYQFSPQPMWRREVHKKIGLFSDTLKTAGDYEFNLRFAMELEARKISGDPVGLYLAHGEALSFADETLQRETSGLMSYYRAGQQIESLYRQAGAKSDTDQERALMHLDLGIRALCYYPPWFGGNPHQEPEFALECFNRAYAIDPKCEGAANNLMIALAMTDSVETALAFGKKLEQEIFWLGRTTRDNILALQKGIEQKGRTGEVGELPLSFLPAGLPFPSQQMLLTNYE